LVDAPPEPEASDAPVPAPAGDAADLPYRGKLSTDSALHYLTTVGEPKTTRQVADALKAGGYESTSPNFKINVYTSLKRLRDRGAIEQVGAGVWQAKKAVEG
jgi:hypothetical protein